MDRICRQGNKGSPHVNGMTVHDWNNDGFVDVAVAHKVGQLLMFQNTGNDHTFLAIKLVGKTLYPVGATVHLEAVGVGNGRSHQMREVSNLYTEADKYGNRDDRIIFGLGANGRPSRVIITWQSGHKTVIDDADLLAKHVGSMTNLLVVNDEESSSTHHKPHSSHLLSHSSHHNSHSSHHKSHSSHHKSHSSHHR
jgi:hypothetical protein